MLNDYFIVTGIVRSAGAPKPVSAVESCLEILAANKALIKSDTNIYQFFAA
jgi:hypothetical protein